MIKINILFDKQKFIKGIKVSGHAGYKKSGEDIVCAGISALTYTLLNSLETIIGVKPICEVAGGFASCILPDNLVGEKFEQSQLILRTIILGYENIEESYKSFVEVLKEEV